jgi:hypothetical protein
MENILDIIEMVKFKLNVILKMTKEKENIFNIMIMVIFIINIIIKITK